MGACGSDVVDVVEQAARIVSNAVRGLNGQPFERPGEVRPLVQQVQDGLRAQTVKLNNSFRVSIETVDPTERIRRAMKTIACAKEMIAVLENPLWQLQAMSVNQRIGAIRSLLELQPYMQALHSAIERAEESLQRFESRQRN